jgi:hypothetical protein
MPPNESMELSLHGIDQHLNTLSNLLYQYSNITNFQQYFQKISLLRNQELDSQTAENLNIRICNAIRQIQIRESLALEVVNKTDLFDRQIECWVGFEEQSEFGDIWDNSIPDSVFEKCGVTIQLKAIIKRIWLTVRTNCMDTKEKSDEKFIIRNNVLVALVQLKNNSVQTILDRIKIN